MSTPTTYILAAGGVVTYQTPEGPLVAIIHRPAYRDWCLPKGKLEEGESFEIAALREVREETGCPNPKITGFAGTSYYKHKGVPKFVHYWRMTVKAMPDPREAESKDKAVKKSAEVDDIRWMRPEDAIRKLTHKEERNVLKSVYVNSGIANTGILGRVYRCVIRRLHSRLAGSLAVARAEHEVLIAKYRERRGKDDSWITNGRDLLGRSQTYLELNRLDEGWKCLHAARRMAIYGLENDELKAKANVFLQEADKLSSWRKKALEKLLSSVLTAKSIDKETIYQAALLIDEHYDNQAFKQRKLQDYIVFLGSVLLVVVLMILWWVFGVFDPRCVPMEARGPDSISVLLFGLFGGAISAALSVEKNTLQAKVPELAAQTWINVFRIIIGGAAALFVFTVMKARFVDDLLPSKLAEMIRAGSNAAFLAVAFVAGFSDRLVLKGVELVTKEKK
jgi:8-oxo-dGTP diphosphatase